MTILDFGFWILGCASSFRLAVTCRERSISEEKEGRV